MKKGLSYCIVVICKSSNSSDNFSVASYWFLAGTFLMRSIHQLLQYSMNWKCWLADYSVPAFMHLQQVELIFRGKQCVKVFSAQAPTPWDALNHWCARHPKSRQR